MSTTVFVVPKSIQYQLKPNRITLDQFEITSNAKSVSLFAVLTEDWTNRVNRTHKVALESQSLAEGRYICPSVHIDVEGIVACEQPLTSIRFALQNEAGITLYAVPIKVFHKPMLTNSKGLATQPSQLKPPAAKAVAKLTQPTNTPSLSASSVLLGIPSSPESTSNATNSILFDVPTTIYYQLKPNGIILEQFAIMTSNGKAGKLAAILTENWVGIDKIYKVALEPHLLDNLDGRYICPSIHIQVDGIEKREQPLPNIGLSLQDEAGSTLHTAALHVVAIEVIDNKRPDSILPLRTLDVLLAEAPVRGKYKSPIDVRGPLYRIEQSFLDKHKNNSILESYCGSSTNKKPHMINHPLVITEVPKDGIPTSGTFELLSQHCILYKGVYYWTKRNTPIAYTRREYADDPNSVYLEPIDKYRWNYTDCSRLDGIEPNIIAVSLQHDSNTKPLAVWIIGSPSYYKHNQRNHPKTIPPNPPPEHSCTYALHWKMKTTDLPSPTDYLTPEKIFRKERYEPWANIDDVTHIQEYADDYEDEVLDVGPAMSNPPQLTPTPTPAILLQSNPETTNAVELTTLTFEQELEKVRKETEAECDEQLAEVEREGEVMIEEAKRKRVEDTRESIRAETRKKIKLEKDAIAAKIAAINNAN